MQYCRLFTVPVAFFDLIPWSLSFNVRNIIPHAIYNCHKKISMLQYTAKEFLPIVAVAPGKGGWMEKLRQIAIDGPVGVGKSTVAKLVAKELGFAYIDTGAMYRAAAYFLLEKNTELGDQTAVCEKLQELRVRFDEKQCVFVNEKDVTNQIRTQGISESASVIASYACVRTKLVKLQQDMATKLSVVMDGRDIGSFVLPDAELKIYLDAELDIRAWRRHGDLLAKGIEADFEEVKKETAIRDERDMNRKESPLIKTPDAIVIDTGGIDINEVAGRILSQFAKINTLE